jgi:hypothetical protein
MTNLMKSITMFAAAALLVFATVGAVQAEDKKVVDKVGGKDDNRYAQNKGVYLYGGLAIMKTNANASAIEDPNVGIAFGGGYRFIDWLAADIDIAWAGREQSNGNKTRNFSFTMNGKVYPIGLISPKTLDRVQPYVVVGMGGGQFKVKNGGSVGTYIFRLGAGTEVFIVGGLSAYMDLSLHATPGYKSGGNGGATGVVQFGAQYHF